MIAILLAIFAFCIIILSGNNPDAEQLYYDVEQDEVMDAEIVSTDGDEGVQQTEVAEDVGTPVVSPGEAGAGGAQADIQIPSASELAQGIYDNVEM